MTKTTALAATYSHPSGVKSDVFEVNATNARTGRTFTSYTIITAGHRNAGITSWDEVERLLGAND